MWLQEQHTRKRRDLFRKKSENGRRTTGSNLTEKEKEQSVILVVDTERIRTETSYSMGYRAGHTPGQHRAGRLEAAIFVVLCKEARQLTMKSVMAHA